MSGALAAHILASVQLSLDGASVSDLTTASTATAGIRVNSDGTVDKNDHGSYSQIDALTDWIRPEGRASSSYQVRVTNVVWTSGSAFTSEAAAEDVWIDLGANREWNVVDTDSSASGTKDVDFDIEIRKGASGGALVSGAYSLLARYSP